MKVQRCQGIVLSFSNVVLLHYNFTISKARRVPEGMLLLSVTGISNKKKLLNGFDLCEKLRVIEEGNRYSTGDTFTDCCYPIMISPSEGQNFSNY
jgi:hypothetical protein